MSFRHVKRLGNALAHALTIRGVSFVDFFFFFFLGEDPLLN